MEGAKICYQVRQNLLRFASNNLLMQIYHSRSHLPLGVKVKSFEARMEATQKANAIKKLELELKEEKQAEIARCAIHPSSVWKYILLISRSRRKQVTKERKQAAEERRRLEEDKARVSRSLRIRHKSLIISHFCNRWVREKLSGCGARKAGRRKSITRRHF